eukprot:scaffold56192_cov32-Attheya_sp.AAC.2
MSSQKRKALTSEQTRLALHYIELLNKPLTSIDFRGLCQDHKAVFGEPYTKENTTPQSQLRRDCQQLFGRLKKKTVTEYIAFLVQYNIPLSKCTIDMMNEDKIKKNAPSSFRGESEIDLSEYDSDDEPETESDDDSKLEPPLLKRNTTPSRHYPTRSSSTAESTDPGDLNFNGLAVTPRRTPKKRSSSRSRDPSTHNRSNRLSNSRTPSRRNIMREDFRFWAIPGPEESPNGTAAKPWIIHFDKHHMENHDIFQIVSCDQVTYGGQQYTVTEFRVKIALGDIGSWEATLEDPRIPPRHKGRCVLVTGPSIDEFSKDPERSDSKWLDMTTQQSVRCTKAYEERKRQLAAITLEPNRQTTHYLIVCPEPIMLDNRVFCHNTNKVEKIAKDMILPHPTRTGETHTASWANFRIAHSGGVVYEQQAVAPLYSTGFD